jgi:hypothetical protein
MTQDERNQLREQWKLQGQGKLCRHERLQSECIRDGSQTGQYICLVCGSEVPLRSGFEDDLCC